MIRSVFHVVVVAAALGSVMTSRPASAQTAAQLAAGKAAIEPEVADLVKFFTDGRIDAMMERLDSATESEREAIEKTRIRLGHLYGNSGHYSGFDIAGYKPLTARYIVTYAMVYFEKRPVMLEIGFYRVGDHWRAHALTAETDFRPILESLPLQK